MSKRNSPNKQHLWSKSWPGLCGVTNPNPAIQDSPPDMVGSKLPGNGPKLLPLQPLLQSLPPDLPHTPALRPSPGLRAPAARRQPPRTSVTARRGTAAAGTGRWPRRSACLTAPPTSPPQRRRVGIRLRGAPVPVPLSLSATGGSRGRRKRRPLFPWQQYTPWPPGRARSAAGPAARRAGRDPHLPPPRKTADPPRSRYRYAPPAPLSRTCGGRGARRCQGACAGTCRRRRSAA